MKTVSTVAVVMFTTIVDRKNLALANSLSLSDQESLPSEHVNQLRSSPRTLQVIDEPNNYAEFRVMKSGTNSCADGYEDVPSAKRCEEYATFSMIPFEGNVNYGSFPTGCYIEGLSSVHFNTNPIGFGAVNSKPVCQPITSDWSSSPSSAPSDSHAPTTTTQAPSSSSQPSHYIDTYVLMPAGGNWCEDGFEKLLDLTECEAYATHHDLIYGGFGNWVIAPKGCHIFLPNTRVYFNQAAVGSGDDQSQAICEPIDGVFTRTPSSAPSVSALPTSDTVSPSTSQAPSPSLDLYKLLASGETECGDDHLEMRSPDKCKVYAEYYGLSFAAVADFGDGAPRGCFVYLNEQVYFNTAEIGSGADEIEVVCEPVTSSTTTAPSSTPSLSAPPTSFTRSPSTSSAPSTEHVFYTVAGTNTTECPEGYENVISDADCTLVANVFNLAVGEFTNYNDVPFGCFLFNGDTVYFNYNPDKVSGDPKVQPICKPLSSATSYPTSTRKSTPSAMVTLPPSKSFSPSLLPTEKPISLPPVTTKSTPSAMVTLSPMEPTSVPSKSSAPSLLPTENPISLPPVMTTGPVTTGPVTTGPVTTGPVTTAPVTTAPAMFNGSNITTFDESSASARFGGLFYIIGSAISTVTIVLTM